MAQSAAPLLARTVKVQQTQSEELRRRVAEFEVQRTAAISERETALAELHGARQLLADSAAGLSAYSVENGRRP